MGQTNIIWDKYKKYGTNKHNLRQIFIQKNIEEMKKLFPDKNAKLIMLCNARNRSGSSARAYQRKGYKNVYVLLGGIEGLNDKK